jgi:DNA-binding LacI/PurR family transcriptional regulator
MHATSLAAAGAATRHSILPTAFAASAIPEPLREFGYGDVTLTSELHEKQLHNTHAVLMELSEDSLLKPFRQMIGQPAPGADLGGWYHYDANYDPDTVDTGFAPAATFGQWVSALARTYAITGSSATRDKVLRLNRRYAQTISGDFYENNRFPAYCYDKLVCGLIDSHQFAGDPDAFSILQRTTDVALPHLPGHAVPHDQKWRKNPGKGYTWDESYTISENLFIAYQRGAGERYRALGVQYLDDSFFDPLAEGRNALAGKHAYSYVNSLSSAMQAYLTEHRVEGVAVMTFGMEESLLDDLKLRKIPLVFVDVGPPRPHVSNIRIDYLHGIRQAVQHLAALRHERIAFITGPLALRSATARQEAFVQSMNEIGITVDPQLIVEGNHTLKGGEAAFGKLAGLPSRPTAVLCSNDMTAMGVMRKSYAEKIAVPQELLVIGFCNIRISQCILLPLTTVEMSQTELGRMAFLALLNDVQRETPNPAGTEYVLKTSLVLRESTALHKRIATRSELI